MKFIKYLLDNPEKLSPLSTGIKPYYERNNNIKSVVFDIYGTLLISASGDIDKAEITTDNLKTAFNLLNIKLLPDEAMIEDDILTGILDRLLITIKREHSDSRDKGLQYPEVDILKIWESTLAFIKEKRWIDHKEEVDIKQLAFIFEFFCNRVFPMPGLKKVIHKLYKKEMPLGIISNAQFYTPIILNYFLNKRYTEEDEVSYFKPDLTVFSYKKLISKPDESLFMEIVPVLEKKYNIIAGEALYVGNDMLKDILPASKAGFRTALFAGDKRSYRIRSESEEVKNLKPDYIITELSQILRIIP